MELKYINPKGDIVLSSIHNLVQPFSKNCENRVKNEFRNYFLKKFQ